MIVGQINSPAFKPISWVLFLFDSRDLSRRIAYIFVDIKIKQLPKLMHSPVQTVFHIKYVVNNCPLEQCPIYVFYVIDYVMGYKQ